MSVWPVLAMAANAREQTRIGTVEVRLAVCKIFIKNNLLNIVSTSIINF